jgi:hypothetical protein
MKAQEAVTDTFFGTEAGGLAAPPNVVFVAASLVGGIYSVVSLYGEPLRNLLALQEVIKSKLGLNTSIDKVDMIDGRIMTEFLKMENNERISLLDELTKVQTMPFTNSEAANFYFVKLIRQIEAMGV